MNTKTQSATDVLDLIAADIGAPRSLGQVVAAATKQLERIRNGHRGQRVDIPARITNLLVTDPGGGTRRTAVARPALPSTPLVDMVTTIDLEATDAQIAPFTVEFTNAADEQSAEGAALDESALAYTAGDVIGLPWYGHWIPVTRQALNHNAQLAADIDMFLVSGLLTKLDAAIGAALAASSDTTAFAFDTDLATTVRTAVAAAQGAMPELGPGVITVAMSPDDHAALDLSGAKVRQWPCEIVSSPSLADGTAYVSRFKVTGQLWAGAVNVEMGYVDDQLIKNTATARATVEALAHLAAPAAIIAADLTA